MKREQFRHHLPTGMQAFAMNTRRPIFADRRVRQALDEVFDFQWLEQEHVLRQLRPHGELLQQQRIASSGLPEGDELNLLQQFKDKLPPELFTKPYKLPVTDGAATTARDCAGRSRCSSRPAGK